MREKCQAQTRACAPLGVIAIHSKSGSVTLLDAASGAARECIKLKSDDAAGGLALDSGRLFVAHERELRCHVAA